MSTVSRRYVEWRINYGREDFDLLRRENGGEWVHVGTYTRSDRAHEAADDDRRAVLADPMATEFKPMQVRIKRT